MRDIAQFSRAMVNPGSLGCGSALSQLLPEPRRAAFQHLPQLAQKETADAAKNHNGHDLPN